MRLAALTLSICLLAPAIGPLMLGTAGAQHVPAAPQGVSPIAIPFNCTILIFRADEFFPNGGDQRVEAEGFRSSRLTATLAEYLNDPSGGDTLILPEIAFAVPFKTMADELIAKDATTFLQQLQTSVASSNTLSPSPDEQALSNRFHRLFGSGDFDPASGQSSTQRTAFTAGVLAAPKLIVDRYLTHRGRTDWIHFTNIGASGNYVIERSTITEFCQYCNGISTAAYYHTFRDGQGTLLEGSNLPGYVLTFPAGQLPQMSRALFT